MITWITHYAGIWSEYAIWMTVQNTIFLSLIFGLLYCVRNRSAGLKYAIAVTGLFKCLLPPFLQAPFIPTAAFTTESVQIHSLQAVPFTVSEPPAVFPLSMAEILFLCWIVLSLIFLGLPLLNTLRLKFRLRHASVLITCQESGQVPVLMSDRIPVPMTLGLFKQKIYVPEMWNSWSVQCRDMILRHELAHVRRKDTWFRILQMVVQALYIFHPMIWLLNRKTDEYREMACDDISVGPRRSLSVEYSKVLVQIAEDLKHAQLGYAPASTLIRKRNELLNRVKYQMEGSMKKLSRGKSALIIGLLVLSIVPLSWSRSRPESPNLKTSAKILGRVIDADTGKPLTGANILIQDTPFGAASDEQGHFIIPCQAGTLSVSFSYIGYGTVVIKDIVTEENKSKQLNVEMHPAIISFDKLVAQSKKSGHAFPPPAAPADKLTSESVDTGVTFVPYETQPKPKGGFAAIQSHLMYPEQARKAGVEGRVTVQAEIDESGQVSRTKVVQSVEPSLDKAAVQAVRAVEWEPALHEERPVKVWIAVPVDFRLAPDEKASVVIIDQGSVEFNGERITIQEFSNRLNASTDIKDVSFFLSAAPGVSNETVEQVGKMIRKNKNWFAVNRSENKEDEVYSFVPYDKPPEPVGGFDAMRQNLVYPESARSAGLEGRVLVNCRIDESGIVRDAVIGQSLSAECDQAALDAVRSVTWHPAEQRDKKVSVWIGVPVEFKLK
ncbi:TonB family protein [bacterium]|nr:TonB family protein [bacterium]